MNSEMSSSAKKLFKTSVVSLSATVVQLEFLFEYRDCFTFPIIRF